jgi:hypothetical protein
MRMIDDKGRDDGYRRNEAMNSVDLESPHILNDRQTPLFLSCKNETESDMLVSQWSYSLLHSSLKGTALVHKQRQVWNMGHCE